MPRYDYRCDGCNEITERYVPLVSCNMPQYCWRCGKETNKLITRSVTVSGDMEPYVDNDMAPTPQYIDSRKTFERKCKEFNVTPMGPKKKPWY